MFRPLFFLLFFSTIASAQSLLILGDSLSAGYQMPIEQSWSRLIADELKGKTPITQVINASISGDTTANGLAKLPQLLSLHHPNWVLIILGANDGLRGFPPQKIQKNIEKLINLSKENNANVLLMQIQLPLNYGERYNLAFSKIYPTISQASATPLIPFFMEKIVTTPGWLMKDGLHPTAESQPWIAEFIAKEITPFLLSTSDTKENTQNTNQTSKENITQKTISQSH